MSIQFGAAKIHFVNMAETLKASKNQEKTAKNIAEIQQTIAKKRRQFNSFPENVVFNIKVHPSQLEQDEIEVRVGDVAATVKRDGWDGDFFRHSNSDKVFLDKALNIAKTFVKGLS